MTRRFPAALPWRAVFQRPLLRSALAGLVLGIAGFLAFGPTPHSLEPLAAVSDAWAPPAPPPSFDEADAVLAAAALWQSQPTPAAAGEGGAAPAPPPRLLGVVAAAGDQTEGVFLLPDGRRLRAGAGALLPDGTRVERIDRRSVSLTLPDGRALELRLLAGPSLR